jgi:hypothetical protein
MSIAVAQHTLKLVALLILCGLVVLVEWLLGPNFARHNLFAPFYAYVVLAVWLGDLWEALGAVAAAAVAAAWLMQPLRIRAPGGRRHVHARAILRG